MSEDYRMPDFREQAVSETVSSGPLLGQTFTLEEVLDALSEAFTQTHPRWARDCEVEAKFKAILSARHHANERVGIEPKQPVMGSGSLANHNPSSGQ